MIRTLSRGSAVFGIAAALALTGCGGHADRGGPSAPGMPLHLEDLFASANVVAAEVPAAASKQVSWRFDEPQPEWKPVAYPAAGSVGLERLDGRLRIRLTEANRVGDGGGYTGAISIDLPDWRRDEWAEIRVEGQSDGVVWLAPLFNLGRREDPQADGWPIPFLYRGEGTMLLRDGRPHRYQLRADWSDPDYGEWNGPWRQLIVGLWAPQPSTFDLVSVTAVSKASAYADSPVGLRSVLRGGDRRRAMYVHTPGRVEYSVRVPDGGRLDTGLGVLQSSLPVRFRVSATPRSGDERTLFEKTIDEAEGWVQATVDLAELAGETVTLALDATCDDEGGVAFWSAPTLSGRRAPGPPNVIFYVIDGAGADLMSVYGYNRRTTPNLERLAERGIVFEHARTNAAWTKPSTASFMTSLQQSVLGGFLSLHDPIPDSVVTMAEHFHSAGYQTGVFSSNPWAGSLSNLQRGADHFQDAGGFGHDNSRSSAQMQEAFWDWRERYPGQPFWAHFQTTDVHEPHRPVPPFAGMFVDPERRERFYEQWDSAAPFAVDLAQTMAAFKDPTRTLSGFYRERLEAIGADPTEFFDTQRGLYDETMAHQDYQIGQLVAQLKEHGEWDNTLLIVASDHGHPAGSFSRFGRELFDPPPPDYEGALFDSYRTRIPMIFIWPDGLNAGRRLTQPVSMIDMLPTLLDLTGLPPPEVMQGQSLAPLMRDEPGWEPRPIILEQLQGVANHGALTGHIEVIDGRWGASLEIWPDSLPEDGTVHPSGQQRAARPHRPEIPELMLYDLWNDPFVLRNVNDRYPELVEKYTKFLQEQWEAHRALATQFEAGSEVDLTAEQLETLRSLGYVQ